MIAQTLLVNHQIFFFWQTNPKPCAPHSGASILHSFGARFTSSSSSKTRSQLGMARSTYKMCSILSRTVFLPCSPSFHALPSFSFVIPQCRPLRQSAAQTFCCQFMPWSCTGRQKTRTIVARSLLSEQERSVWIRFVSKSNLHFLILFVLFLGQKDSLR